MGRSHRRLPSAPAISPQLSVSLQLERSIKTNLKSDLAQAQKHTIQNQTTTMLALGANLMNQTMAQTHKLTAMEAQVTGEPSEAQADPPGFPSFPITVLVRLEPEVPWPPLPDDVFTLLVISLCTAALALTRLCELNAKTVLGTGRRQH